MLYEIHLTADSERLRDACAAMRPTRYLEFELLPRGGTHRMATYQQDFTYQYQATAHARFVADLLEKFYDIPVLRIKVERQPVPEKLSQGQYYETHARYDHVPPERFLRRCENLHVSRGAHRPDSLYVTSRWQGDLASHRRLFKDSAAKLGFTPAKVETELVVYDDNPKLDEEWIRSS